MLSHPDAGTQLLLRTLKNRDCLVTNVDKIIIFLFYFVFSGDTFEKLEDEDEQGWCKGRKDGKVGLYPKNYIEVE